MTDLYKLSEIKLKASNSIYGASLYPTALTTPLPTPPTAFVSRFSFNITVQVFL